MNPKKAKDIYWGFSPLPVNAKSKGIYKDKNKTGCLIELANGNLVCGNAGVISSIDKNNLK